jgi:hypothetical protein
VVLDVLGGRIYFVRRVVLPSRPLLYPRATLARVTDDDSALPKPIAWAKLAAIVVVIGALVTGTAMALHAREGAERDEHARAASQKRAREHEARRVACGLPDGSTLAETDNVEGACQNEILRGSKSPSLVAFPGMFDEDGTVQSPDGCLMTYRSWAAEPDQRGVSVRRVYVCTVDPRTGKVGIEFP